MLEDVFQAKLIVLYVFVLTTMYVHFRGRARLRFARQLSDHSTFLAPINCFFYAFSAVPNRPVLDASAFPDLEVLRENWEVLRDEALALESHGDIKVSESYDDLAFNSFFRHGWRRFYLKWYDDSLPSARALCPRSVELLERLPSIHGAMFALLAPGSKLVAHRDPYAGSLRYHLGLITPNDDRCRIYIDGQPYSWRDGEGIVFDETFIHYAVNDTDTDRVILFCDVERPMRNRLARAFNHFFSETVVRATATKNREGDKVGGLNRIFKYVYAVRLKAKALKRANRRLYYALKYALFGGLLVWLIV